MTIGAWIKRQRTQRGWSQDDIAFKMRVNRSAVAQWESGATKPHRLRLQHFNIYIGLVPEKIVKATWG